MDEAPEIEKEPILEPAKPKGYDKNQIAYILLLVLAVIATIWGWYDNNINSYPIAIPIIIILVASIVFKDRMFKIPPLLLALVVVLLFVSLGSDYVNDKEIFKLIRNVCTGLILSISGIILGYYILRHTPESNEDKRMMIGFCAFTFGLCAFCTYAVAYYLVVWISNGAIGVHIDWVEFMDAMMDVFFTSLVVWIIYHLDSKYKFFHNIAIKFFEENKVKVGKDAKQEVMDIIAKGESDRIEFKSTLRTNIHTGEKDKRMEAAVLKTLVAFLNSNGGDLLIGVKDDGEIIGMDVQTFDNRDKINLHVTNMISIQVGDDFIPYIDYKLVDFEDKTVLHFGVRRSDKPAFVKNGEVETFYARNGPASIELKGSDLLRYFENRYKVKKKL